MTIVLEVLAALGGLATFGGAVIIIARGIFRLVNSTDANTAALEKLTSMIEDHETRISRLEGKAGR